MSPIIIYIYIWDYMAYIWILHLLSAGRTSKNSPTNIALRNSTGSRNCFEARKKHNKKSCECRRRTSWNPASMGTSGHFKKTPVDEARKLWWILNISPMVDSCWFSSMKPWWILQPQTRENFTNTVYGKPKKMEVIYPPSMQVLPQKMFLKCPSGWYWVIPSWTNIPGKLMVNDGKWWQIDGKWW